MTLEEGRKTLRLEAEAILEMASRLDASFEEAVDLIVHCKGRVVVTGMGKSGLIGQKIASTLASTGTPALYMNAAEAIHGDLGMLSRGDTVIAISKSGETDEILRIIAPIKRLDLRLIAITGVPTSTLARQSNVVLDIGVKDEAGPLPLIPTASTTAALAMGDALAVCALSRRGFREEDFAFLHPGGTLGKKLLLKVSDVMHTGHEVPAVLESTTLKDALFEITSKKLGMTTVRDAKGRLKGIITDGDLRRIIEKDSDFLSRKAGEVMTVKPKTIARDKLAVQAVAMMEKSAITSLIVVDKANRAEGVVHLHDLLKTGVV